MKPTAGTAGAAHAPQKLGTLVQVVRAVAREVHEDKVNLRTQLRVKLGALNVDEAHLCTALGQRISDRLVAADPCHSQVEYGS